MIDTGELERDVLGYVFWHPGVLREIDLLPDDFASPQRRKIFQALAALAIRDEHAQLDRSLLEHELKRLRADVPVGDLDDLIGRDLCAIPAVVRALRDAAMRRAGALALQAGHQALGNPAADTRETIGTAVHALLEVGRRDQVERHDFPVAVREWIAAPLGKGCVPSGFLALDQILAGGFPRQALTFLGGRPGQGKTAWLLQSAEHVGRTLRVLFLSLEMRCGELAMRSVARSVSIDTWFLRRGTLRADERRRRDAFCSPSKGLTVVDHVRRISDLEHEVRLHALTGPVDAIYLDYLQLVKSPRGKNEMRHEQLGEIARRVRALAIELDAAAVCGAQLHRRVDDQDEPTMRDLRESGDLENDADVILLLHGPFTAQDAKVPERVRMESVDMRKERPGAQLTRVIIEKQRNGPRGEVWLGWEAKYVRFCELRPASAEEETLL